MNLNIATGEKEYVVNDKCTLRFNPTDPNFIERLYKAFTELGEKDDQLRTEVQKETDSARVFEIANQMDAEMRETIDGILGEGVCTSIFGFQSLYAQADGLPLWANLLLAIVEEMDNAFTEGKKETNPRLQQYMAKFKKGKKE